MEGIEIFFSYAHKDEKWRKELEKHLSTLQHRGIIASWHDHDIQAGSDWAHEINRHLNTAHIILLLVSPDFMASHYSYSIEMQRALERHKAGSARVIPIILRSIDWEGAPFGKLQALPKDAKPITSWSNTDEALTDVTRGILKAIEQMNGTSSASLTLLAPFWNVPYRQNQFFTGREAVLKHLHTALKAEQAALLTQPKAISGLGGIGKTQTAVEYAYRYFDDYKIVLWATANTHETLVSDFVAIAHVLQLPEKDVQDQNIVVSAVKRWLETHSNWLLIVDNADDLLMAKDFLPLEGKGHMLLTTSVQATEPLAQSIDIEQMSLDEGALLLLRRSRILAPDAPLEHVSAVDRATAQEIVRVMDGLPLALDQAGAYIHETKCSLSSYLELYKKQGIGLLKRRGGLASDHPHSVATTWSLAFMKVEQANPAAANLLRLCAFLSPDAIPEAIITEGASADRSLQTVVSDALKLNDAFGELLKYSLVRRNPDQTLTIHRLVQAVLKDAMPKRTQRLWAKRAVQAVRAVFPEVTFTNWPSCQKYLPHALICAALIEEYHITLPEAARLLHKAASYLDAHAQYDQAEILYRHALAIYEKALVSDHPETATTFNNLARLYKAQGQYIQAESLYQRALAIWEKRLGPDHLETAITLDNLAQLYKAQGQYSQAETLYQRALAIYEKALDRNHPETAITLNNLAQLYMYQGQYSQAETLYQRALAIYEKVLAPDHPETAITLNNLAQLYMYQDQYAQAEYLYQRALMIKEKVLAPDHPSTAITLHNLAFFYDIQGQYSQAKLLYQRALAIYEKVLGSDHPYTTTAMEHYTKLLQKME